MKKSYFEQVKEIMADMPDDQFIDLLIKAGLDIEVEDEQYTSTMRLKCEWDHAELKREKKVYNDKKYTDDVYLSYSMEKGAA